MSHSNIGEVSKITNLSIDTLRYYEKEELVKIERGTNKIRKYSNSDIESIKFIKCLKSMGMEIKEIKKYIDLEQQGEGTLEQRIKILEKQVRTTKQRVNNLQKYISTLKTS
ncbi:MerR family transcriptional regulator [Enterococcus sp. DIV0187]|uniref:MerR family transcriptional regulator n=1 Tax=Enterococcus sp. DIV0187 TaxID=2774644 RepID=UPI003F24BD3A